MANCFYDQKVINIDHDAHGYCPEHKQVRVCKDCLPQKKKCPLCGRWLSERNDSHTKKAFFNEPLRGMLGLK